MTDFTASREPRTRVDWTKHPEWIVPLYAARSGVPVHFVHPVGGSAMPYLALARLLGERPCYGVEAPALHGGQPHATVPDAAETYAQAILAIQPTGPFALLGWSMGAALSFEVARLLHARDHDVALLALLDADPDWAGSQTTPDERALLASFVKDLVRMRGLVDRSPAHLTAPLDGDGDDAVDVVIDRLREAGVIPSGAEPDVRRRIMVFRALAGAFCAYRPTPVDVSAILVSGRDGAARQLAAWKPLATGGLAQHVVDADHYSLLRPPHVETVAAVITAALRSALAAPATSGPQERHRPAVERAQQNHRGSVE